MNDNIIIKGAKEHNLKNIDLTIPRNKLVVVTGLSGSGKSSLAFDTLYAEGQRRYVESLSSYARQFLGMMEKPEVESIEGLSPAISIDQKTTSKNPRSTVGTVTEIYDYLRLLYARIGVPYCPNCGKKIEKQTIDQIVDNILELEEGTRLQVLAPVVRGREGEFTKQLEDYQKAGFIRVRIDGQMYELGEDEITLDKKKKHNVDVVVDRLIIKEGIRARLTESVETAMKYANNLVTIDVPGQEEKIYSQNYACTDCGISFEELTPRMFSFNNPFGACPECTGIGYLMRIDEDLIIPDKDKTLYDGVKAFGASTMKKGDTMAKMYFESIAKHYGVKIKDVPIKKLPKDFLNKILYGTGDEVIDFEYTSAAGTRKFSTPFEGVIPTLERRHNETKSNGMRSFYEMYMSESPCLACHGARLRKESLSVKIGDLNIKELTDMSIDKIKEYINNIELTPTQAMIAEQILQELNKRLQFLIDVGLDYLTLSRPAGSLSGGEAQRIRLATQIGSRLTGVLYVLDEPSIGLHPSNIYGLIGVMNDLIHDGNSILLVDHDTEIIKEANWLIEMGPEAGKNGGYVFTEGTIEQIKNDKKSMIGPFLTNHYDEKMRPISPIEQLFEFGKIHLSTNQIHTVHPLEVDIPKGKLTVVTGVSGSGKTTMILESLLPAIQTKINDASLPDHVKDVQMEGIEHIKLIDASPIGINIRSTVATYINVHDELRKRFAKTESAKSKGYKAGDFSYNTGKLRCPTCDGTGTLSLDVQFLPDVHVTCPDCHGSRYNKESYFIKYKTSKEKEYSLPELMEMDVSFAKEACQGLKGVYRKLEVLENLGLGYLTLGEETPSLSGGEAQRLKLASEMSKSQNDSIFIFDEPTIGLHPLDVQILVKVFQSLVDQGATVVVIEHDRDVMKNADYIIDMGPGGGQDGGMIVATGSVEEIKNNIKSITGKYL